MNDAQGPARQWLAGLQKRYIWYYESLDTDEEVLFVYAFLPDGTPIKVDRIGVEDPNLIFILGKIEGDICKLVLHVSQCQVYFRVIRKSKLKEGQEEPRKIGFLTD